MGAIHGYARVSTSDQDVAGQTMRLTEAGAIKVSAMSVPAGRWSGDAWKPCSRMPAKETRSRSGALTVSAAQICELLTSVTVLEERGIALLSLEGRSCRGGCALKPWGNHDYCGIGNK
jgi:hypothetical protein